MPPLAVDLDPVRAGADRLGDAAFVVELLAQLIEIGHLQVGAEPHGAGVGERARRESTATASTCRRRSGRSRPRRSPRMMRRSRPLTMVRSPKRLPTPTSSATSRPERSPASRSSSQVTQRVAPRGALARAAPAAAARDPRCACAAPRCPCGSRPPPAPRTCRSGGSRLLRRRAAHPCALIGGEVARDTSAAPHGRARRSA